MAEGSRSGCGIQKSVEEPGVDGQVEADTATNQQCFIRLTVLELASLDSHSTTVDVAFSVHRNEETCPKA